MGREKASAWIGALAADGALATLFWLERRYPLRRARLEPDRKRAPRILMMAAITAVVASRCARPLVKPLTEWVEGRFSGDKCPLRY
jgi:hypothetical protein